MLPQALGNQIDVQFAAAEAIKIAVLPRRRQTMAVKDIERPSAERSTNGLRCHLRHLQHQDIREFSIRRLSRHAGLAELTPDVLVGQLNWIELSFAGWGAFRAFDFARSFVEEQAQESSAQHVS